MRLKSASTTRDNKSCSFSMSLVVNYDVVMMICPVDFLESQCPSIFVRHHEFVVTIITIVTPPTAWVIKVSKTTNGYTLVSYLLLPLA